MSEFRISDHVPGKVAMRCGRPATILAEIPLGPRRDEGYRWVGLFTTERGEEELADWTEDGTYNKARTSNLDLLGPWVGEGMRLLEVGEVIQDGDDCQSKSHQTGLWSPALTAGLTVKERDLNRYRRRVSPQFSVGDWVFASEMGPFRVAVVRETGMIELDNDDPVVVSPSNAKPVSWEPLDADGLRALVGRVLDSDNGHVRRLCLQADNERAYLGADRAGYPSQYLAQRYVYADGDSAGQPVAKAVPRD